MHQLSILPHRACAVYSRMSIIHYMYGHFLYIVVYDSPAPEGLWHRLQLAEGQDAPQRLKEGQLRLRMTHLPAGSTNYGELNKLATSAGSTKASSRPVCFCWLHEGKGLEIGQEKDTKSLKVVSIRASFEWSFAATGLVVWWRTCWPLGCG